MENQDISTLKKAYILVRVDAVYIGMPLKILNYY